MINQVATDELHSLKSIYRSMDGIFWKGKGVHSGAQLVMTHIDSPLPVHVSCIKFDAIHHVGWTTQLSHI